MPHTDIRLALPSAGRLEQAALDFLSACGLPVYKPNPRQYRAEIPNLPGLSVLFQRPGDIVVGVREGSIDFGIAGLDAVEEKRGENGDLIVLHDALGFGFCRLALAVPEEWSVDSIERLPLSQRESPAHSVRPAISENAERGIRDGIFEGPGGEGR